jgi:tRNA (Thr-GGU) A37 N-methylase
MHHLVPIGVVRSPLVDLAAAPKQGDEGAPEATIDVEPSFARALEGIGAGDELFILTSLHEADREVLQVHPRDDASRPLTGR